MFKKLCHCGVVIPIDKAVCPSCEGDRVDSQAERYKAYDSTRPEHHKVYKTKPWRVARTRTLNRDNHLCMSCRSLGVITGGRTVHHIIPLEDDTSLTYTLGNLISLCDSCHRQTHLKYDSSIREKKEEQLRLQTIVDTI